MTERVAALIPDALAGERVDRVVALLTGRSRAEVAGLVASGRVRLGGRVVTARSTRVDPGDALDVDLPTPAPDPLVPDPAVPVAVVHADPWVVVVDKPPGLVVHPGAGHREGTLVAGLLARFPDLAGVGPPGRPGLVHRLDKGTSGLLVVARTPETHRTLVADLRAGRVERRYLALVAGWPEPPAGLVDAPLGRSSRDPTRMAVVGGGRQARTAYEVIERFREPVPGALVRCRLETGRTHQIRVHLAAIGHPVVGDARYGTRTRLPAPPRPFLHAGSLAFDHPGTGERMAFDSSLPGDLEEVLDRLRAAAQRVAGAGVGSGADADTGPAPPRA